MATSTQLTGVSVCSDVQNILHAHTCVILPLLGLSLLSHCRLKLMFLHLSSVPFVQYNLQSHGMRRRVVGRGEGRIWQFSVFGGGIRAKRFWRIQYLNSAVLENGCEVKCPTFNFPGLLWWKQLSPSDSGVIRHCVSKDHPPSCLWSVCKVTNMEWGFGSRLVEFLASELVVSEGLCRMWGVWEAILQAVGFYNKAI